MIIFRGTIHTISRANRYSVAIFAYSQTIVCLQANECLATGKRSNGASIAPQGLLLCSQRPTSLSLNLTFPFTFPRIPCFRAPFSFLCRTKNRLNVQFLEKLFGDCLLISYLCKKNEQYAKERI
jgi:hypothetical protein